MKKLLSLFLVISIFALASCSSSISDENVNTVNVDSKPSLKIYYMDFNLPLLGVISLFNSSNNKVKIVATEFKDMEEYKNKITTEISAGEGPDIFAGYDFFPSIRKAASSGVFCDLNELISKDKNFKLSEYNKQILDCSIIDGKRYFFPIEYACHGFFTTKELLSQNNISMDDSNWTWKEFAKIAKSFAEKNKGKDKYLVGWNFGFKAIMNSCGISFIDYTNKKSEFNSPEFIELLQAYKDMYPAICTNDIIERKNVAGGLFELLDKGIILLIYDVVEPYHVYNRNSVIKNAMNSETQILSLPTYESGSGTLTKLRNFAAINSNCKYKDQAFEFIKMLLTKEVRSKESNVGIPTKMNIYKDELNFYLKSNEVSIMERLNYENYEAEPTNITQELFDKTNDIVRKTQGMEIVDNTVSEIIDSELSDLLNGRKTAEQVAKQINEKVTIFLNE